MWEALGIALGVMVVGTLIDAFDDATADKKRSWERNREEFNREYQYHRRSIENHLKQAETYAEFYRLVGEHFQATQVANVAYANLKDARETLNTMNKALRKTKKVKGELKDKLNQCHHKNKKERSQYLEEIRKLNKFRTELFEQRDILMAQKEDYLMKVHDLNQQAHQLKILIRDNTGSKGYEWYQRLEERKANRY